MAKYAVIYTPDGKVKHELTYKNECFSYTMLPNEFGKTGDNKAFEFQVKEKFPNESEEVLDNIAFLDIADEDEIQECLLTLSNNEM